MSDFSWPQLWVTVGTSTLTFIVGVKVARFQFELNRQRADKQAANALHSDLSRIDGALGASANAFASVIYGLTFESPTVHRWAEPMIVQLAATDARIVAGFMDLDRELNNFSVTVAHYRLAQSAQEEAREALRTLRSHSAPEDAPVSEYVRIGGEQVSAESRAKQSAEPVANALRMMQDHHGKAKVVIAVLAKLTLAIVKTPDLEFMQLPEEL